MYTNTNVKWTKKRRGKDEEEDDEENMKMNVTSGGSVMFLSSIELHWKQNGGCFFF